MKNLNKGLKFSVLSVAVQSALIALFALPAYAADVVNDEVAALKRPSSTVQIGVGNTSQESAKFGEYNGLNNSGTNLIGNFDVRGGNAYDTTEGRTRWDVKGNDIGTTSRSFEGSLSNQGQWNIGFGYDELRHNITDTYQTPQQGSMGGNKFSFPANFGTINAAAAPSANVLDATQLSAFHTEKVGTTRKNTAVNAGYIFSPELSLQFDFNHLDQSGAKLLSVGATGGVANPAGGTWRAEGVNIIMNPTNYKTNTFNLALNWAGEKGHLTGGYYGSIFRDSYDMVVSENAFRNAAGFGCASGGSCAYQSTVMSTAPDNSLHQLNVSGGYTFSPTTKLAGGVSYGHNTQNNTYLSGQPEIVAAPQTSLNGLVVTTHADLKLTNHTTKDLTLSAALKYDQRNNRSPSALYQYWAINSIVASATNKVDAAANAPYSNKKTQLELAADYRMGKGQNVRLSYERDEVKRWCDSYGITTSNCLVNPANKEDKLGINYRLKALESVGFNAGYAYANRAAVSNGDAVTPLGGLDVPTGGMDVNAQNYAGYIAYPYAERKQHSVKAGVIWQTTERLDMGLNGRYVFDKYNATLGVQDGHSASLNLDVTYAYAENSSVSAYVSQQNSDRNLRAGAAGGVPAAVNTATSYAALVAPVNIWTNQLKETSNTVGLNTNHTGLLSGKLEVIGDLAYSLDRSRYSTQIPYYVATVAAPTCDSPTALTCGDTPYIQTKVITLKLTGNYQVMKNGKVAVGYIHQRLQSNDYFYNGEQYGGTPNRVMPTNLQAANYAINVVTVSYIYMF